MAWCLDASTRTANDGHNEPIWTGVSWVSFILRVETESKQHLAPVHNARTMQICQTLDRICHIKTKKIKGNQYRSYTKLGGSPLRTWCMKYWWCSCQQCMWALLLSMFHRGCVATWQHLPNRLHLNLHLSNIFQSWVREVVFRPTNQLPTCPDLPPSMAAWNKWPDAGPEAKKKVVSKHNSSASFHVP